MANRRAQRYLIWIGAVGVLTSCLGCSLIVSNQPGQLTAARIFLVAGEAWASGRAGTVPTLTTGRRILRWALILLAAAVVLPGFF